MGFDTTYTLVGEGRDEQEVCDNFDSSTTEFGITKTVDCEPYWLVAHDCITTQNNITFIAHFNWTGVYYLRNF